MERVECNSLIISDFVVFQLKLAMLIFLVAQDERRCNTCIHAHHIIHGVGSSRDCTNFCCLSIHFLCIIHGGGISKNRMKDKAKCCEESNFPRHSPFIDRTTLVFIFVSKITLFFWHLTQSKKRVLTTIH